MKLECEVCDEESIELGFKCGCGRIICLGCKDQYPELQGMCVQCHKNDWEHSF